MHDVTLGDAGKRRFDPREVDAFTWFKHPAADNFAKNVRSVDAENVQVHEAVIDQDAVSRFNH